MELNAGDRAGYFAVSKRPLQILVFLLPLICLYELAMLTVLQSEQGGIRTNTAHMALLHVFDLFGIETAGWFMPGALIIAVLLIWQTLAREPWRINGRTLIGMTIEAIVLAIPLLVFGQLIARVAAMDGGGVASAAMTAAGPSVDFQHLALLDRIAISVGAGLYEELVFRMLILAILHALFVDLIRATPAFGGALAVTISAILFAAYHFDITDLSGSFSWPLALFYVVAGVVFGALFLIRGFGIVVAVHAIYDIVTAFIIEITG